MITEEEAKTKWCPFARTAWATNRKDNNSPICTVNRGNIDNKCNCIASECMAWESSQETMSNWHSTPDVPVPIPDENWEPYGDVQETTKNLPEAEIDAGTKQYMQMFRRSLGDCGLKR